METFSSNGAAYQHLLHLSCLPLAPLDPLLLVPVGHHVQPLDYVALLVCRGSPFHLNTFARSSFRIVMTSWLLLLLGLLIEAIEYRPLARSSHIDRVRSESWPCSTLCLLLLLEHPLLLFVLVDQPEQLQSVLDLAASDLVTSAVE